MKQYKAYAKVNVFLKITGTRGVYHEILSRFVLVKNLYDTLSFEIKERPGFSIIGNFNCTVEQNTIYKSYLALYEATNSEALERLMQTYAVKVDKKIPSFAGLGGGSSDAATYLLMCNEVLHLGLSLDALAKIGSKVGADIPFFIYGYQSANVSGVGEIVEKFDEQTLNIETYTPAIEISTPRVYQSFRKTFYKELSRTEQIEYARRSSLEIFEQMDAVDANDLFAPAQLLYPEIKAYHKEGWFFSGSGSSFFRIVKD